MKELGLYNPDKPEKSPIKHIIGFGQYYAIVNK
jgi:hypothetical protein